MKLEMEIKGTLTRNKGDEYRNGACKQTELKTTGRNDHSLKILSFILSVLNLCMICLLLTAGHCMHREFASYGVDALTDMDLKLPCDDVSLSLDEDDETFGAANGELKVFADETGRYICSFGNITAVIEKTTERASRVRLAKGLSGPRYLSCGNFDKAPAQGYMTAYFTELTANQTYRDRGYNGLVNWESRNSNSFIGPGISYHNGKIQVNVAQNYFVYAYITFVSGIDLDKMGNPASYLFNLWIFKANAKYDGEYERIHLKSTGMLHSVANSTTTQYVGSHVYLRPNEEIYVKVTNTTRLVHTLNGNGFGIFPFT